MAEGLRGRGPALSDPRLCRGRRALRESGGGAAGRLACRPIFWLVRRLPGEAATERLERCLHDADEINGRVAVAPSSLAPCGSPPFTQLMRARFSSASRRDAWILAGGSTAGQKRHQAEAPQQGRGKVVLSQFVSERRILSSACRIAPSFMTRSLFLLFCACILIAL